MAVALPFLSAAGSAMGAIGQMQAARAQRAAVQRQNAINERIAERNAQQMEIDAEYNARRRRQEGAFRTRALEDRAGMTRAEGRSARAIVERRGRSVVSRSLHAAATEGPVTGSALMIAANNAAMSEFEVAALEYSTEAKARGLEDEAAYASWATERDALVGVWRSEQEAAVTRWKGKQGQPVPSMGPAYLSAGASLLGATAQIAPMFNTAPAPTPGVAGMPFWPGA